MKTLEQLMEKVSAYKEKDVIEIHVLKHGKLIIKKSKKEEVKRAYKRIHPFNDYIYLDEPYTFVSPSKEPSPREKWFGFTLKQAYLTLYKEATK